MMHGGLIAGKDIYAIQLVYGGTSEDSSGDPIIHPVIFSARDVYVWPSGHPPRRTSHMEGNPLQYERIATYPFFGHHKGGTYNYRICEFSHLPYFVEQAFPSWQKLVNRAMDEWQDAVPVPVVTLSYDEISECSPQTATGINNDIAISLISATDANRKQSEIRVISQSGFLNVGQHVIGMPTDLFRLCFTHASQVACSSSQTAYRDGARYPGKPVPSADIWVKYDFVLQFILTDESNRNYLEVPEAVKFNKCFPEMGEGHDLYRVMLHEIGHALGLANSPGFPDKDLAGSDIIPPHIEYDDDYSDRDKYLITHPTITDSVISYQQTARLTSGGLLLETSISDHNCSPQPFDTMAMYALYQNAAGAPR